MLGRFDFNSSTFTTMQRRQRNQGNQVTLNPAIPHTERVNAEGEMVSSPNSVTKISEIGRMVVFF